MSETDVDDATKRQGPPRADKVDERLAPGTLLGRYIVLEVLGAGGMGVVYAAYDPELNRNVAVKLVQASAGGGAGYEAWLLREAQAMAQLSHPNVITVHDVGSLPGERVFVAMELVDGTTLRKWMKERERPWREVLAVMRAAGRGLAAAHKAGLVHRDFKPDNVLVGKDGRVRVMDFGLARLRPEDAPGERPSDRHIDTYSPLSASLTVAGTVVGTPAYMAPEVATAAQVANALSDQFSFGVALYEALFRIRPFAKEAPPGTPPKPPPRGTQVPTRIQRVVMRAIAVNPNDRYASMDALVAELSIDALARRRRIVIAAFAIAAFSLAMVISAFVVSRSRTKNVCKGAESRLAGVWDPLVSANVRVAFEATKRPFAASSFAGLDRSLDRYASEWAGAVTEACEATRVRGEQTEDVLTLRQTCLDQRLAEMRALTRLLVTADAELVQKGDKVVAGLEPINRCANIEALRAPGRPPVEPRAKVQEIVEKLAEAKAGLLTGHFLPSLVAAKRAADLAEEIHYPPYKAEALVVRGASLGGVGNLEDSALACEEAVWAATLGKRDDLVVGAALCAAATAAQHKAVEARIWIKMARMYIRRLGADPVFELRAHEVEGLVAAVQGDMQGALAAHQQAIAQAERIYGKDGPELWNEHEILGTTFARIGAYSKAMPYFERAIALREISVGKDHPDIAVILTSLGACYAHAGDNAKARAAYERALAIKERFEGKDNPSLALTLNNMADGLIKAGDVTSALFYLERAKQLAETRLGRGNPLFHAIETTRAEALVAAKRLDEARKLFDEVIALETEHKSIFLAGTLMSRATAELGAKRWADAATFAQRSIAAHEASSGKEAPELWQPLVAQARAYVELGRKREAKPLLERAIGLAEKAQIDPKDLVPARELLQQVSP